MKEQARVQWFMIFTQINTIILKYFYYLLLALLFFNMLAGRKGAVMGKRRPIFFFAFYILFIFSLTVFTVNKGWPEYIPTAFLILVPLVEYLFFKEMFFPYHITCRSCRKRLTMDNIFVETDYLCQDCKVEDDAEKES
jgi:hypothetical protein